MPLWSVQPCVCMMGLLNYAGLRRGSALRPAGGLLCKDVLVQVREYLVNHHRIFSAIAPGIALPPTSV